jgi:hypothetical protein
MKSRVGILVVFANVLANATYAWPQVAAHRQTDSAGIQMQPFASTAGKFECHPFVEDRVLTRGMPTSDACIAETRDTVVFTYRARDSMLAAVIRQVRPKPVRVDAASRAMETALVRRYGEPTVCHVSDRAGPPVTRYLLWRRPGYVVQFRTTVGSEKAFPALPIFVEAEILRDETREWPCLEWLEMADWTE